MERDWGFLRPWCELLRGKLSYECPSCDRTGVGDEEFELAPHYIHIRPTESYISMYGPPLYKAVDLERVRKALSLLSAIAKLDFTTFKHIMTTYCFVTMGDATSLPCYVLHLDSNVKENLIKFCGARQRTSPSADYTNAMQKIAGFYANRLRSTRGVEFYIPVRVYSEVRGQSLAILAEVHEGEAAVSREWRRYEQSEENHDVPLVVRCTLFLEPMIADIHGTYNLRSGFDVDIRVVAETLDRVVRQNMRFSHLSVRIESAQSPTQATATQFSQLIMALFGSTRRYAELSDTRYQHEIGLHNKPSHAFQLDTLHLTCRDLRALDVEALFSAMATNQTTRDLVFNTRCQTMSSSRNSRVSGSKLWQWLAYGMFSKRARELSALESLTLWGIDSMTAEDMRGFAAVVASDHPEQYMYTRTPGRTEEQDATLLGGAPIFRYTSITNSGFPQRGTIPLSFPAIHPVRTFSDDGRSEWANVFIPGVGRCSVKRTSLEFDEVVSTGTGSRGLTSLKLYFPEHSDDTKVDGLAHFFSVVGAPLTSLTLDAPRLKLDDNVVLRHCPNLHEFWRRRGVTLAHFDFSEYQSRHVPLPELRFSWDDISALAMALSDDTNPVAKIVRLLTLRLTNLDDIDSRFTTYSPEINEYLDSLLQMLEKNRKLEYLKVTVPSECDEYESRFKRFHHQPIGCGTMALEEKLAFLSVLSVPTELPHTSKKQKGAVHPPQTQLGEDVLSRIFVFASPPVLRQVKFTSYEYEAETD